MKKYKQVMAALLAMNLTVYVMPTGVVKISASVESQSNEDTTEKTQTESTVEPVGESDVADNANALTADEAGTEADTASGADDSAETEPTETPASDSADNTDVEITDEDTEDSEDIPDVEISDEQDSSEIFSDGSETDNVASEDSVSVQANTVITGELSVKQFKDYKEVNGQKQVDITSVEALILLSHCKAEELQDVNINFSISGNPDITVSTTKIAKNANLSGILKTVTSSTENAVSEIQQVNNNDETSEENTETVQSVEASENESDISIESEAESAESDSATVEVSPSSDTTEEDTITAGQEYTFQGIGSYAYPFKGKITGEISSLKIDRTFFKGLSSEAEFTPKQLELIWCGEGNAALFAELYQFDSDGEHQMPAVTITGNTLGTMGSLIGIVRTAPKNSEENTNTINNPSLVIGSNVKIGYDASKAIDVKANANLAADTNFKDQNAGLICNTLSDGTICLNGYGFPSSKVYAVTATSGNAGGIIGYMSAGTKLKITTTTTVKSATVKGQNAGGMVGEMATGAEIESTAEFTQTDSTVEGTSTAGGVAGQATDVTFGGITNTFTITTPKVTGTAQGAKVGGFIGNYVFDTKLTNTELTFPVNIVLNNATTSSRKGKNADDSGDDVGGYFGALNFGKEIKYVMNFNNQEALSTTYETGLAGAYGAIVGHVTSTTKNSTLSIQNLTMTSNYTKDQNKPRYHGGVVGKIGTLDKEQEAVYVEIQDVNLHVINPYAKCEPGFGGIAGCLAINSTLKVQNMSLDTTGGSDKYIWEGGGVVGRADKGSALELSGITDLSKTYYVGRYCVGQLVAEQNDALIYACGDGNGNGWTLERSVGDSRATDFTWATSMVNDIGNYGQIIRLNAENATTTSGLSSNLIKIDETTHNIILNNGQTLDWSSDIKINSADEFALLSIAWSSEGYFSADQTNVNKDTWKNLFTKNIKVLSDVDLSGTGINGLGRDTGTYSDSYTDSYTGTLDGTKANGEKSEIILAIGENYGLRNGKAATGEGSGKVYTTTGSYHCYLGLFAKAGGTIKNITVGGTINVSTHGARKTDINGNGKTAGVTVGSIAAVLTGNAVVDGVTVETEIIEDWVRKESLVNGNVVVGGMYGYAETEDGSLEVKGNSQEKASINLTGVETGTDTGVFAGGVIGRVKRNSFTTTFQELTVGGSISTSAQNYAYVGGLIGENQADSSTNAQNTERKVYIKGVTFDGLRIVASNATEECGGLFGSIWSDVGTYFMGPDDNTPGENTKLTVKNNCIINAPNASVGGLAYRSSGIWEIRHNGIDIKSNGLTIKAGTDVGLLVCRGEYGRETLDNKDAQEVGALYLRTTEYWEYNAYKLVSDSVTVTVTGNTGVFDEFVAHTATTAAELTDNYKNGVVSIATQNRLGVAGNQGNCTTYQNRTAYGRDKTNGCSRYYYDLDEYENSIGEANGYIDTPEELMLWSVRRYAYNNLKQFFNKNDCGTSGIIGTALASDSVRFDMQKYSYYPINLEGGVGVQNCTIKFYNKEIEAAETGAGNKTTTGHTQHFTMHCGLFLNHYNNQYIEYDETKKTTVSVNKVTFEGSIGKYNNNGSGVLFAGTTAGYVSDKGDVFTAEVKLNNITFHGLNVVGCGTEYAPLLMNYIRSYTTLEITDVKTKSYQNVTTGVASSLLGHVGASDCTQISIAFKEMVLPDKNASTGNGIFTHASFLESFQYARDGSAVATYNFYKEDDWNKTTKAYDHKVTYGQEITGTTEYPEEQKWYYDADLHGNSEGEVHGENDDKNFSAYLPYVCVKYKDTDYSHEIKVNQRVSDITNGCGTYGHPYEIASASEMKIISEYISTGEARKDWRVKITSQQTAYCVKGSEDKDKKDITFQYDGESWFEVTETSKDTWEKVDKGATLEKQVMHRYMLNAYYDIQGENGSMELEDFHGFGSSSYPFRGVITSSTNATIVLKGSGTGSGLIPYSYGSVVKDLTISYEGDGITLEKNKNTQSTSDYYPNVCFGGVIGCVLGGDNIIDNVTVEMKDGWVLTLEGDQKHLIEAGGYVGAVCGGGVIFRGMIDAEGKAKGGIVQNNLQNASLTDGTYTSLYVNPYVGRVMDGFAFNETSSGQTGTLQNTDKNYQIKTLTSTDSITATNGAVNIKSANELLILSAIINSGAAAGGKSNSYNGTKENLSSSYSFGNGAYGKVRNAAYSHIGEGTGDSEFSLSQSDDRSAVSKSNLPYLISKYCDSSAAEIVFGITESMSVNLTADIDMTACGSGYQGIGARYVSNAVCYTSNTVTVNRPTSVVPKLGTFNGNSKTLTVNMQVKEYVDDDFHAASVGGLFNLLDASASDCTVRGLTLNGTKSTGSPSNGVSLTYYTSAGAVTEETPDDIYTDSRNDSFYYYKNVGVGGIAGSTTSISAGANNCTSSVAFNNVSLNHMAIAGPVSAGGLIGNVGRDAPVGLDRTYLRPNFPVKNIAILIQPDKGVCSVGVNITDCSYDDLTVSADTAAGGFAGYVDGVSDVSCSLNVSKSVSEDGEESQEEDTAQKVIGNKSTIGTQNDTVYAGGVFGYIKSSVYINKSGDTDIAVLQGVNVYATDYAGGFIGKIDEKEYQINNVGFKGLNGGNCVVWAVNENDKNAAGEVTLEGQRSITGRDYTIPEEGTAAGGILGMTSAGEKAENKICNAKVENICINSNETYVYTDENNITQQRMQRNGGVVGYIKQGNVTIEGCEVATPQIYGSRSGGIMGAVGIERNSNVAAQTVLLDCKVSGTENTKGVIRGSKIAGGLIGVTSIGKPVRMEKCESSFLQITSSDWGAGGMIGDVDYNTYKDVYFFDCAVKQSEIKGADAGGYSGTLRGNLTASNLLLYKVSIESSTKWNSNGAGMIIGHTGERTGTSISVAGISLQEVIAKNRSGSLTQLFGIDNKNNVKSYCALADYKGSALTVSSKHTTTTAEKISLLDAEEVVPYVVTSPQSKLSVAENADSDVKYLYGDGASWTDTGTGKKVNAQEIYENSGAEKDGHYAYSEISGIDFDFTSVMSTYNANQSVAANQLDKSKDFPVLRLTTGDSESVTEYLDILTNGGFSAANNLNTEKSVHVEANTTVYSYDKTTGKFVKAVDENGNTVESALKETTDDANKISFSTTTDYDNDKERFTLLTVTFKEYDEKDKATCHEYKIQVPVIVRRMLEMDFSATLSYGTNFRSEYYKTLSAHVLENFGNPITGYLTYTYNSASGTFTDYGWQSYIDAGGNVAEAMDKAITFNQGSVKLPQGTQLSLVDCRDGKVYYYTATGSEENNTISLSSFVASDGKTKYEAPSLGELMNVSVAKESGGTFVKVDENGKPEGSTVTDGKTYSTPTVRIKTKNGYEYYRLAESGETGEYAVSVDEESLKEKEKKNDGTSDVASKEISTVTEDYYLVITVPKNSSSDRLNGSLETTITSDIPHQIHYLDINGEPDGHGNTASTYLILSGYQHTLKEENITAVSKKLSAADSVMKVDVVDTITFPNDQIYGKNDELYLRFVGGLQNTVNEKFSAEQFPDGTTGTAYFYVYKKDGNTATYYKYNGTKWEKADNGEEATKYTWTSDKGTMELPLADENKNVISLKGIRELVQESSGSGETSTFYVELKMDASIPISDLEIIPESAEVNGEPDNFIKFVYSSQLSTVKEGLSYSTNRASEMNTLTKYYREEPTGAKLTYEADLDKIGQLGINLLDLQYQDEIEKQYSMIDTNATYDLTNMKNLDTALKDSNGIRFTVNLLPKNTIASETSSLEDYQEAVKEANRYLEINLRSKASGEVKYSNGTWSWTVPKATYWDDTKKTVNTTNDVFNGTVLTQDIQLKVRIDNVEDAEHYYSNYRVVLTAEILDQNGQAMDNTHLDDNIIYTLAKIKPDFVDTDNTTN